MTRVGVFGVGHLGKIHLKCLNMIDDIQIVGFYDVNKELGASVETAFDIPRFEDPNQLIEASDILDIVTETSSHFEVAKRAIQAGKHVFIEKPVTKTLDEARELIQLRDSHQVKVQVGHVERFNPVISSIDISDINPLFIEAHRLSSFKLRGTDVSVVLDLMIHDIDILLHLVSSEVESISANGVGIVSSTPDIANARIEFKNGCVANLTASRMSLKGMRKMRIFNEEAYVSLDFLDKKAQIIKLAEEEPNDGFLSELETNKGKRYIQANFPEIPTNNAIKDELESFIRSVESNETVKVSLEDGYKALKLAYQISEKIEAHIEAMNQRNSG